MKRFVLFLLVSPFLLLSCEKETVLTLDQAAISFTDAGGSQDVSLTANKPWTVSTNQSWCKVSPSGGEEAASSRVTITCDANTSYDERNCTVTFTCAELTKTVSVTQATNNGLLVSQTSYELTKAAQQLNIEVKANVKFSVEIDADCKDWITYNTTKGLTTNMVVLDIAENKSYDGREGKVTIKQNGGNLSSTITIKQSQLDGLFISTPEYNLSNEKHTLTVEVSTNVEFDVTSEADWVKYVQTKGLNSKQIILEVAENDTYDQRETKVNVKQKNGDIRGTIVIKQDEKYGILVTQSEYDLSNEAQTIEIEVKYNVDFDVVIPSACKTWIKQVSTKSLDSKTYSLSISQNKTYDNREGSITFKQKNGNLSTTVVVKQAQTDYLEVVKNEYVVDIEGETITIDVQSNVDYSVSLNGDAQSWLSIVETKGLSKNQVLVAVASGDDNTDRKGMVIISYGNLKRTVLIHQYSYAANTIIQFADEKIKAKLVEAFDTNKDGELSIREAREVKSIKGVFGTIKTYASFDEFEYFTGLNSIPNSLFEGWRLSSIKLPISITVIGNAAFKDCKALPAIVIPENVTSIGESAFSGCTVLEKIQFPKQMQSIGRYAFQECTALKRIELPSGIQVIGLGTFQGCCNLSTVILPNSITQLENGTGMNRYNGCFKDCISLKEINLPDSIFVIGASCFWGCRSLASITIPDRVTAIQSETFYDCSGLKTIKLSDNCSEIGHQAFSRCGLSTITFPSKLTTIGSYAFYNCENLTSISLPNITKLGEGAFYCCTNLTSIIIPESVTEIGKETFRGCKRLSSVTIPESVSSIGQLAFDGCESLTDVKLPDSIIKIVSGAFKDCSNLTEITIPSGVTELCVTFPGCTKLAKVSLPSGLKSIAGSSSFDGSYLLGCFSNCTSLKTITLPDSIEDLGEMSFLGCTSLEAIVIPENVKEVYGFRACTGLKRITISDKVSKIGNYAFLGCTGLTTISLPESITEIERGAFIGCTGLKEVYVYPKNPPMMIYDSSERAAFYNTTCSILVPAESINKYKSADGWSQYAYRIQAIP